MRLRGYDEYEVTLGDELRGERASLGKTLLDVERDLRIKADLIRAIEDCDLEGFPNDSVVAGYVRSYTRYLGLDAEDCYRRFCAESGFRSPVSALGRHSQSPQSGGGLSRSMAAAPGTGVGLDKSRFALTLAPMGFGARVSLGSVTSGLALAALIVGLAYGGYALLQDIQRVGFAPLPEAPEVIAEAPPIGTPTVDFGLLDLPDSGAHEPHGVLAATSPGELTVSLLPARDGPISAIDPATSGLFRDPALAPAASENGTSDEVAVAVPAAAVPAGPPRIFIHATDDAWIRVRDGENVVVFEGTLGAGERFEVPYRVAEPTLRAGNAGAVYVLIGDTAYGPVGGSGSVIKNLSLRAEDVTSQVPQATAEAITGTPGSAPLQRAAAVPPQ